ncbi:MAG: alpha-hydroxy-acid oxidizing protein [Solirubrobacterales bacterium]|nr:alpha-hydroxy-acid oxidizing protein [Solirubrobacterales bacterium]
MVRVGRRGSATREATPAKSVYSALIAHVETGFTLEDNVAAFGELGFAPHVAGAPVQRDMSTSVMGQQISLPVFISPTGVQSAQPDGEVAVARRSRPRHRDGPEFVRQQAHRGRGGGQPADLLPGLLGRFARADRNPDRPGSRSRRVRIDRCPGLDVLPQP